MKSDTLAPPVMVVDDDENDVLLLRRLLETIGVANPLLHFRTGGEAFMFLKQFCPPEKTSARMPCLMFLDVNMEGLSGFDVLLWARQQPPLAAMKIFMLSGANEEWDAQISAKLGADEYLEKFPPPDEFKEILADICVQRSRQPGAR